MVHFHQLRRQDRPDRPRIHAPIRMASRLPVHRAGILARPTPDAVQRLPSLLVRQHPRPRIVQQHHMERLRPVLPGRIHPPPDRVVRIHPLPSSRPRQHLQHHLQVRQPRNHLIDPRNRNQRLRQRQAHPPIPFALDDTNSARLRDQKIGPTHPRLDGKKLLPQKQPRRIRQVLRRLAQLGQIHLPLEYLPNLLPVLMQRRHHNMRRLVVSQLNN